MSLRVPADRGAAEEPRLEGLVVDAAAHERARRVGACGIAGRADGVALLRLGGRPEERDREGQHENP
jgi:hypothetical protein